LTELYIYDSYVGDAGASAIADALDRGALLRLDNLSLFFNTDIGDAGLVALAPALWRRPALEQLCLSDNPLGDDGLAALVAPPVAPPPPTGTPAGELRQLKRLNLENTNITGAGCNTLAHALVSGALPALEELELHRIPASGAAKAAVRAARANLVVGADAIS
jgi:hypothetical protein